MTVDAGEDGGQSEGATDVRAHADDGGPGAQQRSLPQFYITTLHLDLGNKVQIFLKSQQIDTICVHPNPLQTVL